MTISQLSTEFAKMKRGVTCLATGKACSQEDKNAAWTVAKITGAVGLIIAAIWGYQKRAVIGEFLTRKKRERPKEQVHQQEQAIPKIKYAIKKVDYTPTDQELKEALAWKLHNDLLRDSQSDDAVRHLKKLVKQGADLCTINKLQEHQKDINNSILRVQRMLDKSKDKDIQTGDIEYRVANLQKIKSFLNAPGELDKDYAKFEYQRQQDRELLSAVINDDFDRVIKSLEHGANPNSDPQPYGYLLEYALHTKKSDIAEKLMKYGADPNKVSLESMPRETIREKYPVDIAILERRLQ
jgi:hypothetical protein